MRSVDLNMVSMRGRIFSAPVYKPFERSDGTKSMVCIFRLRLVSGHHTKPYTDKQGKQCFRVFERHDYCRWKGFGDTATQLKKAGLSPFQEVQLDGKYRMESWKGKDGKQNFGFYFEVNKFAILSTPARNSYYDQMAVAMLEKRKPETLSMQAQREMEDIQNRMENDPYKEIMSMTKDQTDDLVREVSYNPHHPLYQRFMDEGLIKGHNRLIDPKK